MKNKPDNTFTVFFDGGWNGCLYGSWEIRFNGFSKRVSSEQYDTKTNPPTCNVAEYEALISALKWLQSVKEKGLYSVDIWGDSMLVVNQVREHGWKVKKAHLQPRRERVRYLLLGFKQWSIRWHGRSNNVSRFGH